MDRDLYYQYVDERVFPTTHAFEQLRIKKYEPNGLDQFDTHVDVVDHDSAKRYLSFMWYLNDVDVGGNPGVIISLFSRLVNTMSLSLP